MAKLLDKVTALDNHYSGVDPATIQWLGDVPVLAMDGSVDEFIEFLLALAPDDAGRGYSGGGLTLTFVVMAAAITGNFALEVAISHVLPGTTAPGSSAFTTVNSSGSQVIPGTTLVAKEFNVTFTDGADMDNWSAGDDAKVRVNRDTGIGGDLSGDLFFLSMKLYETGT